MTRHSEENRSTMEHKNLLCVLSAGILPCAGLFTLLLVLTLSSATKGQKEEFSWEAFFTTPITYIMLVSGIALLALFFSMTAAIVCRPKSTGGREDESERQHLDPKHYRETDLLFNESPSDSSPPRSSTKFPRGETQPASAIPRAKLVEIIEDGIEEKAKLAQAERNSFGMGKQPSR